MNVVNDRRVRDKQGKGSGWVCRVRMAFGQ